MKKRFSKALALLLAMVMVFSLFPAMSFATEVGSSATFMNGLPADGSWGVIFNVDNYVMGYDLGAGDGAPAKSVTVSSDGTKIESLPNGTAVIKFIAAGSDYYLTIGGKYLTVKDIDSSHREKLVLTDAAEETVTAGSKWTIIPDQGGKAGYYNIKNATYKYNGKDVYLEVFRGAIKPYSYNKTYNGQDQTNLYQFKFASTTADEDGRVGEELVAGPLPEAGSKVVIYNEEAKAVFGQLTGPDQPKVNLTPAEATLSEDGTLAYDDIADGGLIFDVTLEGEYYTFQTGGKYLAMSENVMENDKVTNEESLHLEDTESDYTKWKLDLISGGYRMTNKAALWGSNAIVIEYFGTVFCGYSYYTGQDEKYAMNFYPIEDTYNTGYVVNPAVTIDDPQAAIGADCTVKFTIHDVSGHTALQVQYVTTDRSGHDTAAKTAAPELNGKVGTFTIPAEELEGMTKLTVTVTVTDALGLTYTGTGVFDILDEPQILSTSPAANSATGDNKRPEIYVTYSNVLDGASFEMKLDDAAVPAVAESGKLSYTPAEDLTEGKHTVTVTITRADGKSVTRNWAFFVGEGGETLYFGQIHSHTSQYSDGAGTLADAYQHAHAVDDMDFLVVTDHSNYFDTTATATTSSYYDLSSLLQASAGGITKWEEARATAKQYNELYDDFICLYGYEMTWSGGPGHTNSFNTYGVVSRNNKELNNKTSYAGMHRYNDLMVNADKGLDIDGNEAKTTRNGAQVTGVNATKYIPFDEAGNPVPVVSQFNHPGKTFGNFDNYAGYTAKRDDVLNLIEVGNGEGKVGGSSYFPSYEEYDLCLSMGWHVGPTNNQDNHKGNWGDSNTCRDVILTDDFSEIGIYRALDERRIYATEDQNLEIFYELEANGETYKLGDIAPISEDDQPAKVTVRVTVNEPDRENIDKIQIIGEGAAVLKEITVNARNYQGEIELDNTSGYYYVKVIEADKQIAVTAPVWVKEAIPIAASVETSASVAAQGEEENIIATLTNGSETEPLTLTGYTVVAEGNTVVEETGLNETVAASTDKVLTVPFTPSTTDPSAKKTYDIEVTFHVVFKGKELSYSKKISETSYPPELMTYIGLDKGHTNFYVSGDYAGNEGSFIQICAERGIICQYIEAGQMTKENLSKYKAVVLTVPRKSESVAPTVWTAEELEALKDYADKGGNLINLSKSDRYDYAVLGADGKDTYAMSSATLSNLVNEAVGAKTRFVRGIVVDNDRKANEAYRIYFDGRELLGDHLFTQGIFTSSNGQYQWYNGTGITVEPGADVTTLVAPYATSWVASYKDNFTGSAYVPDHEKDTVMADMGTFSLVTCEKLSGGGFLVCAGACFISNYDLKYGTASNEQYENYGLVCNILDYIKDGEFTDTVTPIADVHKGAEGQEFTIEGWITSNASDYDKDTAFFDCVYIQDETRGINAFPVSGYYYIGEKVRAHGGVTYYCGEIELNLSTDYNGSIQVISNDINEIAPQLVTCKQAMSDENIGNLMKVRGVVTEIHETSGVIDKIYLDDGSGEQAMLFINAYIQKDSHALDDIKVGMKVEGVGIGSRDVDEASGGADGQIGTDDPSLYIKRLRVRSRDEIRTYSDPCDGFTDIDRESWYHDGVDYVIEHGIMNGTSDTTFEPNGTLTRGQMVTILYRLDGEPEITGTNPFTDVPNDTWYTDGVIWASSVGITDGVGEGIFDPNGQVTREQLATFFYRYAAYAGYDTSAYNDLTSFPDQGSVSSWAREAVSWTVGQGLVGGTSGPDPTKDYLAPQGLTTRAQFATILLRFDLQDVDNRADLVILFTNDVHCGIDSSTASFGYAGLAAYKKAMEQTHDNVGLVDAGDFIQGGLEGILTKGEAIVRIMNGVGYQAATLGNHEFDYGVTNIGHLMEVAEFPILSCDFTYTGPAGNETAVTPEPYVIIPYGETEVAFVGISTPETLVKASPAYFQDEAGNWIYDFANDKTGTALYTKVQTAVDAAKAEGADYIVAVAHLGIEEGAAPWRSTDLIANTNGIDAVLDGHSHSVIPCQMVANKDGKEIPLSSTGTKLANVGKLTIDKDGEIKTELVARENFSGEDPEAAELVAGIKAEFEEQKNAVVMTGLTKDLLIVNPDRLDASGNPVRAVRYQETNMADVCADALYEAFDTDVAFVNGGGVRDNIKAGDVTYGDIIKVCPFMNELLLVEATGQQLADALEFCARNTYINEAGQVDGEFGSFMQVSGLKYTIYTGTPTSITYDSTGTFTGVGGARRVGDIRILNKTTGQYEPIDLNKTYKLVLNAYNVGGGDGVNMFTKSTVLQSGGVVDSQAVIDYFQSETFAQRLAAGMYDNWDGEGRITITADEAPSIPVDPDAPGYKLTTALSNGDKVVIYHPDSETTNTAATSGKGLDVVKVTVAGNVLTPAAATVIYTVEYVDSTNFLLKTEDGKYLTSAPTGNGLSLAAAANEYSQWYLQVVDEAAGKVGIRSTNAEYNGNKNQALEYYQGVYTTYGWKDNNTAYIFQLYVYSGEEEEETDVYELVTEAPEDWTGTYLIAASKDGTTYVFNGNEEVKGCVETTVANGRIKLAEGMEPVVIEAMEGGYSLHVTNGYMYNSSSQTALKFSTTPQLTTLAMDESGNAVITSGATVFRFNSYSNQLRFRFFKNYSSGSVLPVQLYKLVENG